MNLVRRGLRELRALFVDDGRFAIALVAWLALICLGHRWLQADATLEPWTGPILFAGIAVLFAIMT